MNQDNEKGPKRSENKGSTLGPTFFLSLFLLVGGVVLVMLIVNTLNEHEIAYQDLVRLIQLSQRDEQGRLADNMTGVLVVDRDRGTTIEQVQYSNLRDVRVGDRSITGNVDYV